MTDGFIDAASIHGALAAFSLRGQGLSSWDRENQRVQTGQVGLAIRRLRPLSHLSEPACSAFRATTLATTFGRFGLFRNPLKHWGTHSNRKPMLITRDIPTLTDLSPPTHQWGFQSHPLRQLFKIR